MSVQREAYSITEAAVLLGVSTDFVRSRIADGTLPAFRFGAGKRAVQRIRRDDLRELFRPIPVRGHNPDARLLA